MPSPTALRLPLMSRTSLTDPRLMPARTRNGVVCAVFSCAMALTRFKAQNIAVSGSPKKQIAAPSPVSRMMRSDSVQPLMDSDRYWLNRRFHCVWISSDWRLYWTMSRNTTLHSHVRSSLIGSSMRVLLVATVQHLHRGRQAAVHAVEGGGQDGDLVFP